MNIKDLLHVLFFIFIALGIYAFIKKLHLLFWISLVLIVIGIPFITWTLFNCKWEVSWFFSIVGISFVWWQIRENRLTRSIELIYKQDEIWNSERMRCTRKLLAEVLKFSPKDMEKIDEYAPEILDFFELLGFLIRRKQYHLLLRNLPTDIIWQTFSYYVFGYYEKLKAYIEWLRKETEDMTAYSEFQYLYEEMKKEEHKQRGQKFKPFNEKELDNFIKGEKELL